MQSLIQMCRRATKAYLGAAVGLGTICLTLTLTTLPSNAQDRRWSFSDAFEAPVVTDCEECGDDIGMMLRCKGNGQPAEVTVHWAAVEHGKTGKVLPITFTIAGRQYVYQATTQEFGLIGFTPEFSLPSNDPLIEALQTGASVHIGFSGGTTDIGLTGARGALDAFKAHCARPDRAAVTPVRAEVDDQKMVWQNSADNDMGNKGRYTARLTHQVPETDNVQFEALCVAGSSGTQIQMIMGYDLAGRSEGEEVKLTVAAGTYKATHSASIYGTELEVGVSGVLLYTEPGDPFWQALASGQATMTYGIAGGPKANMQLNGGGKPVRAFIGDCRDIHDAQRQ